MTCLWCPTELPKDSKALYCSAACQRAAYRHRRVITDREWWPPHPAAYIAACLWLLNWQQRVAGVA